MSDDIDTEYTLTEVQPLTHEQIYAEYNEWRKKFVDAATYEHEIELRQRAVERVAQLERTLAEVEDRCMVWMNRAEQAEADAKKLVKLAEHRNCKWQEATRCDCGLLQLFNRYELGGAK